MNASASTAGTALVTGVSGFIGGHLTERLLRDGWRVVAVARPNTELGRWIDRGVHVVRDHGDTDRLVNDVAAHGPSVCFHLATHFLAAHRPHDIAALIDSNITFGTRLAEAAVATGDCRFISAASAWQHLHGAEYAPVSLYAATKQAFADVLRHYSDNTGLSVRTLTLFDTYGADDRRAKLLPLLLRVLRTGESLEMSSGLQYIDLLDVRDVVQAFLVAADDSCPDGTWTVASGRPLQVRDLVDLFGQVAGRPLDVTFGVRPDRPNEMTEPWVVGALLPGWIPQIALRDGLTDLLHP